MTRNLQKEAAMCATNLLASFSWVLIQIRTGFRCKQNWAVRDGLPALSGVRPQSSELYAPPLYLCPNPSASRQAHARHMSSELPHLGTQALTLTCQNEWVLGPVPSGPLGVGKWVDSFEKPSRRAQRVLRASLHTPLFECTLACPWSPRGPYYYTCGFLHLECFPFRQPGHSCLSSKSQLTGHCLLEARSDSLSLGQVLCDSLLSWLIHVTARNTLWHLPFTCLHQHWPMEVSAMMEMFNICTVYNWNTWDMTHITEKINPNLLKFRQFDVNSHMWLLVTTLDYAGVDLGLVGTRAVLVYLWILGT